MYCLDIDIDIAAAARRSSIGGVVYGGRVDPWIEAPGMTRAR